MATFRKVGKRWRAEVRKKGVNRSKYFDSKMRAREWSRDLEFKLGGKETLADAFDKYSKEVSPGKKGNRWEQVRLLKLTRAEIATMPISLVESKDVARWRDESLRTISGSSVNREMNLLSSVFEKARKEWGWCGHNPVRDIERPKSSKERKRRISDDEIERLQIALGFDGTVETKQHEIAVLFLLAIETAMRLGEMTTLEPEQIHLSKRYVELLDTKNGSSRNVPLSTEAVKLLSLVPDGFTVESDSASTLFSRARKNAGIVDLKFHDSRREALSRLSKRMDVMNLAKISGHRDLRVLLNTYYAPDVQELVDLLD